MSRYYPINLNLKNKKCLVIGAGEVAGRKARRLVECGAKVLLIAPAIPPRLNGGAGKRKIAFRNRQVLLSDLKGFYLVICATNDRRVNRMVSSYCQKKGILVNVVDSPQECNFILPSVVRRGALAISISTSGISPALSKSLRRVLEQQFGVEYARFLGLMKKIRPLALKRIKNASERKAFFKKALCPDILALLKDNKVKEAKERLIAILENAAI